MNFKWLKSRTVWTLVLLFVINGIEGIRGSIDPSLLTGVDAVLTALAMYFRINTKVK